MADPRCAVPALLGLLLSACSAAPPPAAAPAPREVLSAGQIDTIARVLRSEDRREFDPALLAATAESAAPVLRRRAATAVGRLRAVRGLPLLQRLLSDADTGVAAAAAFALGQVGDTGSVSGLAAALRAGRPDVAAEAAYALGKIGSEAAGDSLLALLRDPEADPAVVGSALLAAWRTPRPADSGVLLRWTTSPDAQVRWSAAYALTRRSEPRAVRALLRLAGDPDQGVRAAALRGLTSALADSAGVPLDSVVSVLVPLLREDAYAVRINAARALGTFRNERAVQALAASLGGGDAHLRIAALEALGRIGPSAATATPRLRSLADSAALPSVRGTALEALARVAPEEAAGLALAWSADPAWRLRVAAARARAAARGASDPSVLRLVRDGDGRVSAAALEAAVAAADGHLAPLRDVLLERLGAGDVFVRATALGALGRLGDAATLPLLLDAYARAQRDSLDDAALAAVDALAALDSVGVDPARAFLARFSRSPDYLVRRRARTAFGERVAAAWGEEGPASGDRPLAEYRALVEQAEREPWPEVVVETDSGTLRLRLFARAAPLTVASFLRLTGEGYFDGQQWPRVVPNFVVQGGDPRGDTNGGPGYNLRDELNPFRYGTGTVGMALSGPDTGGSQFFITHSPQPHLDGTYAVFGQVVQGQDVTHVILPGDRIHSIRRVE